METNTETLLEEIISEKRKLPIVHELSQDSDIVIDYVKTPAVYVPIKHTDCGFFQKRVVGIPLIVWIVLLSIILLYAIYLVSLSKRDKSISSEQ